MPKGEAKRVNKDIRSERERINKEHDRFGDELYSRLPGARNKNDKTFDAVYKGFEDILSDPSSGVRRGGGGGFGQYEDMFKRFAETGGLDAENINRIRGKGVFDEFAKTGGFSESDLGNIRSRGNSTIPAYFNALRDEMGRKATIQGGGGPAYTASLAKIARDQSRGAADTALNTELGIKDRVNEGRRWGSGSLSEAERALAQILSSNKVAGMEGGLRAAGMGADDDRFYAGLESNNRMGALEGLRGLRTDTPGEEFGLYDFLQKNIGQRGQLAGGNMNLDAEYNPNRDFMDRLTQFGGAVSGMIPGLSQLKNPFKKASKPPANLSYGRNYGNVSTWSRA